MPSLSKKYYHNLDLDSNQLISAVIENRSSAPASGVDGQVYYNTVDKKIYYYNAALSLWQELGAGGGGLGTVTSVAFSVPTGFTISGSPITSSGTLALSFDTGYSLPSTASQNNWHTAYGWGNHATAGYLTQATADGFYVQLLGSYSNPSWITSLAWSKISGEPTTVSGYGITDVYTNTQVDTLLTGYVPSTRTLTINGVSYDLSANRSWTISVNNGTVTSVSVVSANGFAGTVATATSTPAITLTTTITGILKGNGTAISAAVANTDYQSVISLTTTGTSGAATFNGTTLNIPQYADTNIYNTDGTLTGSRTLTLSGNSLDIIGTTTTRFFSNGRIGVNTTTDSGYQFDINGTARVQSRLNLSTDIYFLNNNTDGIVITGANVVYPKIIVGSENTVSGNTNLVFGKANTSTGLGFVFGTSNTANSNTSMIFGTANQANTSGQYTILIGGNNVTSHAVITFTGTFAIGDANTLAHQASSILGSNQTTTANNQLIIASSQSNVNSAGYNDIYFGTGPRSKNTNLLGSNITINGSGAGAGTDLSGGNVTIAGGKGTGAGTPGDVIISTASTTTSGTTLQSLTQRLRIAATTGNVTIATLAGSGTRMVVADASGVLSTQAIPAGSGGVSDGDKGDITVSASGTTWTIDDGVVTVAKISATGTPSASTYLRGDGTWATVTASSGYTVTTQTSNYTETITSGTRIIACNTTGGTFTVTLPTAVGNTATIIIKKTAGAAVLTVDGAGTETIDGGLTAAINKLYESITLISDNANWQIV
jgi:hypothetical protein